LFFRDFRIGYALLEVGGLSGGLYEELRASLSSALRSIILFEREEAARAEAERADSVKSHLLGNVSHELKAPAALIRDGALRVLAELSRAGACPGAAKELERIVFQAEHQERLLSDLIDISRAQIEELDVERALLDPLPILREAFDDFAQRWRREGGPAWELELPAALPAVEADPTRIRQILYNLLGNAAKFTDSGFVRMSALAGPGWIELRVADSGRGIAPDRIERIFEPFVSSGGDGVGLGLSISRHLALLHGGSLRAESRAGSGSSFVLRLPLPSMEGGPARAFPPGASRIILISARTGMEAEIAAAFPGMEIQKAVPGAIGRRDFSSEGVAALAWEAESSGQAEWELLSSFRRYPPFRSLPLLIYGDGGARTCLLPKGKSPAAIIEALALQAGAAGGAPILAADDDPEALAALRALLAAAFPDSQVLCARDGEEAWGLLKSRAPRLAVLDISMPRLGGIDLLERLRADELLSKVPVLLFTSKALNLEDVKRIEGFSRVALGIKGTWTAREAQARLKRLEAGENELPAHSSAVVKRSLAYLHRNYRELVTRWRLADEANVSEDHLTRLFKRELGLSPWEYLARFRIRKAKELLETTDLSVSELSGRVGFQDQAYFSRVFRKLAGASPQAYRDSARSGGRLGSGLLYEGLEEKAGGCQPVGPQVLDEDGRAEGQGSDIAQR
jgi:signal transduction histidine kinase/AraC-like DNA-binding protein